MLGQVLSSEAIELRFTLCSLVESRENRIFCERKSKQQQTLFAQPRFASLNFVEFYPDILFAGKIILYQLPVFGFAANPVSLFSI